MYWVKDPLLLPYTYTRSRSIVDLLLHLQYYQRCKSMNLELWVKSKFVLWQTRYYNWLKKKNNKRIYVFEALIIWKRSVTVNLKKFSLNTAFTLSNSINSMKDLIGWKRGFAIFLIDHYAGDIGNNNITGEN